MVVVESPIDVVILPLMMLGEVNQRSPELVSKQSLCALQESSPFTSILSSSPVETPARAMLHKGDGTITVAAEEIPQGILI
jgi:hypothetical protein